MAQLVVDVDDGSVAAGDALPLRLFWSRVFHFMKLSREPSCVAGKVIAVKNEQSVLGLYSVVSSSEVSHS